MCAFGFFLSFLIFSISYLFDIFIFVIVTGLIPVPVLRFAAAAAVVVFFITPSCLWRRTGVSRYAEIPKSKNIFLPANRLWTSDWHIPARKILLLPDQVVNTGIIIIIRELTHCFCMFYESAYSLLCLLANKVICDTNLLRLTDCFALPCLWLYSLQRRQCS